MAKGAAGGTSPFPEFDFSKMMADFKVPGLDYEQIAQAQRKNVEAITNANKVAMEGFQAVLRRQTEILQQTVEELTKAMGELSTTGSPQDKAARQTELAREAFEKAMGNMREIAEMVARSSSETFEVINKRVTDSLDEVRGLIASAGKQG